MTEARKVQTLYGEAPSNTTMKKYEKSDEKLSISSH